MSSRLLAVLTATAIAAASACGGSSSETPWPVEPEGTAPGPEGESGERRTGEPGADVTDEAEVPEAEKPNDKGSAPKLLKR
jgi:hypothetical protein